MFGKLTPSSLVCAIASLAFSSQLAAATAVPRAAADIFVPPVLYPNSSTVWTVGESYNVLWDVSNAPKDISNPTGLILLRKANITTPVILQNGFDITSGAVEITVPWLVDGTDYSIILLGDSGNDSQDFTITGSGVTF